MASPSQRLLVAKSPIGQHRRHGWVLIWIVGIERTAPTFFLLYSLVVWWHEFVRTEPAPVLRSWPNKPGPSFAEMLAALRVESLEKPNKPIFRLPQSNQGFRKSSTN